MAIPHPQPPKRIGGTSSVNNNRIFIVENYPKKLICSRRTCLKFIIELEILYFLNIQKIRYKYKKIKQQRGAEIKDILYITRDELFPHIYENADFSPQMIKALIREGETKTVEKLNRRPDLFFYSAKLLIYLNSI